jgi:iron complex outermembrane receptor protein
MVSDTQPLKQIFLFIFFFGVIPVFGASSVRISGQVTDAGTGKALAGANIVLEGTVWGASTGSDGQFILTCPAGSYRLIVRYIGYSVHVQSLDIREGMIPVEISLNEAPIELSEVLVTATRTPTPVNDIPAYVTVLSSEQLEGRGGLTLDDALAEEPGIDVQRAGGPFTMSPTVVLRGTGGNEPSRTLVMIDGIPVNKSDTGESNWNRLKTEMFDRVEIVRGPASALYGASAMGGVINLITKTPEAGIHANLRVQGGNLGTAASDLSLSGGKIWGDHFLGFFLMGSYLQSDGYIAEPAVDRTPFTVKRFLHENSQTAKLIYIHGAHEISATYQRYDDERGEGEKIMAADGEFRNFDTDFFTLRYQGGAGRWHWEAKGFHQLEQYSRIDERMRGDQYERFDVLSDREDQGLLLDAGYTGLLGRISAGLDVKQGSVDGADTYRTSPDIVANRGKVNMVSGFAQDEISIFQDRLNMIAGLRFDQVRFHLGHIYSTLAPWNAYNGDLDDHTWQAVSPKIGINAQIRPDTRMYFSVGRAFRGSILDDLCRSGWMWVGPKIANPYLEPETMTNTELGFQQVLGKALMKIAGYYALGHDFLYYTATGDSVFGRFALYQKQNVARVLMNGIEASIQVPITYFLDVSAGFTLNRSEIDKFPEQPELEGKILTYTPQKKAKIVIGFHQFLDGSLIWEWVGKQYTDDLNTDVIDTYQLLHFNFSRKLMKGFRAGVMIRNILDTQYLQSNISLDPGRIILGSVSYEY